MHKFLFLPLFIFLPLFSYEAIVFDFGGVMAHPDPAPIIQFVQESLQLTPEELHKESTFKENLILNREKDREFWKSLAKKRGVTLSSTWVEDFRNALSQSMMADQEMFNLVETLKENGYRIGLLSNIEEKHAEIVSYVGLYAPFDPCLLSYEIDVEKPNSKAYQKLIEALNLKPESILFIDDMEENVEAAKEMGIDAIHFTNIDKLKTELEPLWK